MHLTFCAMNVAAGNFDTTALVAEPATAHRQTQLNESHEYTGYSSTAGLIHAPDPANSELNTTPKLKPRTIDINGLTPKFSKLTV